MKLLAPLLLILSILPASAIPRNAKFISPDKTFDGADRTITWRPWQQNAKDEFRFRRGDRYLSPRDQNHSTALHPPNAPHSEEFRSPKRTNSSKNLATVVTTTAVDAQTLY